MPIIIIGNKSDLPDHEVTSEMLDDLINKLQRMDIRVFNTSAVSGYNVDSAFKYMIYEILGPFIYNIRQEIIESCNLKV